ncbi:MAG TPA: 16S rRNA (guanine(527)-N(7))-methyltransferase RsmG [bacterium]|nr:16S rRNA (guanine(527)-N(7))-methyltransferase RsmG [bacterium]HPR86496.1 16S rRNA (guanine(527)-N(7))-methyltransferase RsmG [bacterium]
MPQAEQAERYVDLIEEWNQRTNLVSRQDVGRIVSRHVRESLWFCRPEVLGTSATVLDLGSGAGFPGVPMKIQLPELQLTLLDSRRMKALFLNEVVRTFGWKDVSVRCERAETLPATAPGLLFDLVVCRAVARLPELWRWSAPLLHRGGRLAALKGGDLTLELRQLRSKYPGLEAALLPMPELPDDPEARRQMIVIRNA